MTTMVKIIGTGTEIPVEDEIADNTNDWATLRRALSSVSPGMPKAKITEKKVGENRVIEVQPKLDGKGVAADEHLRLCRETRNPAIDMFLETNARKIKLGSHEMYNMGLRAKAAVKNGEEWIKKIEKAEHILVECKPASVSIILPG